MDISMRKGGDITAADMFDLSESKSDIKEFFKGTTAFVDGATGFLGKLVLEKLLRTCNGIKKIYILLRPKKGKDIKERFKDIFDVPIFDVLRRENPNYQDKIEVMIGDISEPCLGLSENDKELFIKEVNCIFHIAATVRFDEKLRLATYINVRATRDVLLMAKQMKQLKSFVHVSTAYSHCIRQDIEEKFYDLDINGDKLLKLVETLDDQYLDAITPTLLGKFPNSYVFTKAAAEDIVNREGKGLPLALVRPSIVLSTANEPVTGWIDNYYGATGVLTGAALGLIRSLHAHPEKVADMVPADYVVNTIITSAWDVATTKSLNENNEKSDDTQEIQIYNYVSGPENPIKWKTYMALAEKHLMTIKSPLLVWHYCFALRTNIYSHKLAVMLLHYLPAYIIDFIARCIGKNPILVKAYRKIGKFSAVISYFAMNEWKFTNKNTQELYRKLSKKDKELFHLSMTKFSWDEFFYVYSRGIRVYLMKDPLDTIPQGKVRYRILQISHYTLVTFLLFLLYKFLMLFYSIVFG